MHVTIDRVGRVVIPKALRVALGITPETPLELILDGSGLRIEPVRRRERSIDTSDDGLPILGDVEGAVLTDGDVRRLRDDIQR
ncbi:AbrB/MazE/SpoVT family DNA-binding domain-containing protein [Mycolicibacterium sp.]|uniref:AbrB/MazE/SpoVT family DNA-binding domain-containing protein n=1 Tax=Mycolicibacterium sp. TaxID=2320850 RepID=UPI00355D4150